MSGDNAKYVQLGLMVASLVAQIMAQYRATLTKEGGVTDADLDAFRQMSQSAVDEWFATPNPNADDVS